jgi:hypothetical protein
MAIIILLFWPLRAEAFENKTQIFYEDEIDFSPDFKKLENPENLQISIHLQNLDNFIHSPYASPELVKILKEEKDLEIIFAKATTIMRATGPGQLHGLISDDYFMDSAFRKSRYKRIDQQNFKMCQRLKIKALGYQKEINIKIHHIDHFDLENSLNQNILPEYLKILIDRDKKFYQTFGFPISAVDIDVDVEEDIGIRKGKLIVFFFQYDKIDTLIISYQFFAAEKCYFRFIPDFLFKKISQYAINKFAPTYRRYIEEERVKALSINSQTP